MSWFIAGCSGIFAGSYVMTPMIAGGGGAYLLFRDLRVKYPISQFMLDAGVAFITVTPWLPHLWALWKRRDGLAWITEVNSAFAMELLAPFLFAIVIGSVRAFRGDQPRVIGALTATLWAATIGQFGVMMVLAEAGTNVLFPRYAIGILIPDLVVCEDGCRMRLKFFRYGCDALLQAKIDDGFVARRIENIRISYRPHLDRLIGTCLRASASADDGASNMARSAVAPRMLDAVSSCCAVIAG